MENVQIGNPVVWQTSLLAGLVLVETPVQYIGKVLGMFQAENPSSSPEATNTNIIFATPHGIVEIVRPNALRVATSAERKTLRELEVMAEDAKKEVYGGPVAVQEILKKNLTGNKK